jgi:hypothetical protein
MVAQAAATTPRAAAAPRAGATATPRTKAAAGRDWRTLRGTLWGTFGGLALGRTLGGALGRRLALLLTLLAGHLSRQVFRSWERTIHKSDPGQGGHLTYSDLLTNFNHGNIMSNSFGFFPFVF